MSEPVETEATTDETTNWDAAADELEMLDDAELYGEESEYEACEQDGEVEMPVADAADTTTSWDNGSESWTEEESWESETDAVEEEMIEADAAEDYSCKEFDYENHNECYDADAVANEPEGIDAASSDEYQWSGDEYDATSDEYDTEAMEADVEVSESSDGTIDETPEAAESCDPCPTSESETEMTDVEEPIDPVLPDPTSAVTRLEQLQQQLLQAAAQAYQGVRSRVAGMADRLHFIAVTETGAAAFPVPVDEVQR